MPVGVGAGRSMIHASDCRIQRREHAVRVLAVDPDVPIEVGFEHVRLVDRRVRVIGHRIERDAMECRPLGVSGRAPGVGKHQRNR